MAKISPNFELKFRRSALYDFIFAPHLSKLAAHRTWCTVHHYWEAKCFTLKIENGWGVACKYIKSLIIRKLEHWPQFIRNICLKYQKRIIWRSDWLQANQSIAPIFIPQFFHLGNLFLAEEQAHKPCSLGGLKIWPTDLITRAIPVTNVSDPTTPPTSTCFGNRAANGAKNRIFLLVSEPDKIRGRWGQVLPTIDWLAPRQSDTRHSLPATTYMCSMYQ